MNTLAYLVMSIKKKLFPFLLRLSIPPTNRCCLGRGSMIRIHLQLACSLFAVADDGRLLAAADDRLEADKQCDQTIE